MDLPLSGILVRTVVTFVVLLALVRAAHKRAVSGASPFEFVLALVLGDTVDKVLLGEVGVVKFVVAVSSLTLAHAAVGHVATRSPRFDAWVNSTSTLLVKDGRLDERAARGECVSEADVEALLRLEGVDRDRWSEVREARLETNGHASVLRREG